MLISHACNARIAWLKAHSTVYKRWEKAYAIGTINTNPKEIVMKSEQIKVIQDRSYVVEVYHPETDRIVKCAFSDDVRAVWFMERTVRLGSVILGCVALVK